MAYDLENIIIGIFRNLVAGVILRTMEYIFNKNKDEKKFYFSVMVEQKLWRQ